MAEQEPPERAAMRARARPGSPERRIASDRHGTAQRTAPSRSSVMRLAGEVERLQAELAAMRAKLADVEAKVDIDPLLDIFNRRGFARELSRALSFVARYGTRAALLYVDLDGFKPVNDTHGHAAGDAVLKSVAATLQRNVRASDTVARLGGDEFAVLLWNLDERQAAAKALALEQRIAATVVTLNGVALSVGASAGFTTLAPGDDMDGALARADRSMYARKAERKQAR